MKKVDLTPVLMPFISQAFFRVLNDIHQAGILHRDLSPGNLMLDDHGTASIIDFDRATRNPTESQKEEERESLTMLLNARVPSTFFSSDAATPGSSEAEDKT